ncbi:MAG: M48 family metalloprotease [Spirochaetaceae bacterium]|nr:MAG: M48 family metalloprotease [Spirochaetaceae bacterium]
MSVWTRRCLPEKRGNILFCLIILLSSLLLAQCQTVPATGETRLSIISTVEEIRIGREADSQIRTTMGIYDHEALQDYLGVLGLKMAKVSERPDLPWSFRVLDDDVINAFAAPGGFIYVTRGILAHCNSGAELAAILGHEIGHVTAKHTVIKLSRMQLVQFALEALEQASPVGEDLGALAGVGLQLLFLKFSREDELEADELGVRYLIRIGENPRRLIEVMEMLERVSRARGGGDIPQWLSTHPSPGDRRVNLAAIIEPLDESSFNPDDRESYLRRLNGLMYGKNPREGYAEGGLFVHPDLRFQVRFPSGWGISNQKTAVFGSSPDGKAAMRINQADTDDLEKAVRGFFAPSEIAWEGTRSIDVNGNPGEIGEFVLRTDQGLFEGEALFVIYRGRIYQIVGYGGNAGWRAQRAVIHESLLSFAELTDPKALSVQPLRLEILSLRRSTSLREYYEQRGSPIGLEELALLNRIDPNREIGQGQPIKWVAAGQ